MATIDSGSTRGRKQVDHEIPLVPFVDLLLCCLMFLLVTAVWAQLGSLGASAPGGQDGPSAIERPALVLTLSNEGLVVASTLGDEAWVAVGENGLDIDGLTRTLARHRVEDGGAVPVRLMPDDDVDTELLVATMDTLRGAGFGDIGFPGAGE